MINYNLTKDKHEKKTVYKLTMFQNEKKFEKCFTKQMKFTHYTRNYSIHNQISFIDAISQMYTTNEMKRIFLDKYSKIDTLDRLSKFTRVNKYKLDFILRKYGFISNANEELLFESKDINGFKDFLSIYVDAIKVAEALKGV